MDKTIKQIEKNQDTLFNMLEELTFMVEELLSRTCPQKGEEMLEVLMEPITMNPMVKDNPELLRMIGAIQRLIRPGAPGRKDKERF